MMKKLWIYPASLILVALFLATGLQAQHSRRGNGPYDQRSHNPIARQSAMALLELTDEQRTELQELRTTHFSTVKPLRNKMVELKARERTLLSENEVDLKALNKVIDEQTDLMNKMKKLEAEQKVAVKGILTDEQIMNLERQRERRQQFRYKGNERWESPRRGGPYHRNMG